MKDLRFCRDSNPNELLCVFHFQGSDWSMEHKNQLERSSPSVQMYHPSNANSQRFCFITMNGVLPCLLFCRPLLYISSLSFKLGRLRPCFCTPTPENRDEGISSGIEAQPTNFDMRLNEASYRVRTQYAAMPWIFHDDVIGQSQYYD